MEKRFFHSPAYILGMTVCENGCFHFALEAGLIMKILIFKINKNKPE